MKNNKISKIIAGITAVSVLAGSADFNGYLVNMSINPDTVFAETDTIITGECGKECSFALDTETGTLTVSGSGEMYWYLSVSKVPWNKYSDKIKTVIIEDGITTIGQLDFEGCVNLESVSIADSVSVIDYSAFAKCESLVSVRLPKSLAVIENNAFDSCKNLKEYSMPEEGENFAVYGGILYSNDLSTLVSCPEGFTGECTVAEGTVKLSDYAFRKCQNLSSVVMPDSVTEIGKNCFVECSLLENIILPDSVTSIGDQAFSNCTALESVECSENLTSIGGYAFYKCKSLKKISVPDGVKKIDEHTFDECSALEEVYISNTLESLGVQAFYKCESLKSVLLPETLTSIGKEVFYGCSSLESANIPSGITKTTPYLFKYCSSLSDVILPDTLTYIASNTFEGCTQLENIVLPEGLETIGDEAFLNSGLKEIIIPDSLKKLSGEAFKLCKNLESVKLPDSLKELKYELFRGCTSLKEITLPSAVETLGTSWAAECTSLENIYLSDQNETFATVDGVIYSKDMKNIILCPAGKTGVLAVPEGTEKVSGSAFKNCIKLSELILPESIEEIVDYAFLGSGAINVKCLSTDCTVGHRAFENKMVVYAYDGSTVSDNTSCSRVVSLGPAYLECSVDENSVTVTGLRKPETEIVIPELIEEKFVTEISDSAFDSCGITMAELPQGIVKVGKDAFLNCPDMKNILLSDYVVYIGEHAFGYVLDENKKYVKVSGFKIQGYENSAAQEYAEKNGFEFESLGFGDSTNYIAYEINDGKITVTGCDVAAVRVKIPSQIEGYTVTEIADEAFKNCKSLVSVDIPDTVEHIGNGAFYNCVKLERFIIPEGIEVLEESAFFNCSSLKEIVIPDSVKKIQRSVFYGCKQLETAVLPKNLTEIESMAFTGCISLKEINLPEGLTLLGSNAFERCESLEEIVIPSGITIMKQDVFSECKNLKKVVFSKDLTEIESGAFSDCSGLESVDLPDKLENIGDSAFAGSGLKEVKIPDSVTKVYCSSFDKTPLEEENAEENVFIVDCVLLKARKISGEFVIPDGVRVIADFAAEDQEISSLVIPEGVVSVGMYAFQLCTGLYNISFPSTLKNISIDSFSFTEWVAMKDKSEFVIYNDTLLQCYGNRVCSVDIVVPYGIKKIDDSAFLGCHAPSVTVVVPETVTYMTDSFSDETKEVIIKGYDGTYAQKYAEKNGCKFISQGAVPSRAVTSMLNYRIENNEAIITGCKSMIGKLEIPEEIEGCKVTKIEFGAFGYSQLSEIKLPSGITEIGEDAFYCCVNLNKINIPDSVKKIGDMAFEGCSDLREITLNSGLTELGNMAFFDCQVLKKITLPDSLTKMGDGVFALCRGLESISVSEKNPAFRVKDNILYNKSMTKIISSASAGISCELVIPEGVKTIGNNVFTVNTGIEKISMPSSLETIESLAFRSCTKIKEVEIPENVKNIGEAAFFDCGNLKNIIIHAANPNIEERAFGYYIYYGIGYNCLKVHSISSFIATLTGVPGSSVEKYADENKMKFVSLYKPAIPEEDIPEDLDGDGAMTARDIIRFVKYILDPENNSIITDKADLNKDGKIDVADLIILKSLF